MNINLFNDSHDIALATPLLVFIASMSSEGFALYTIINLFLMVVLISSIHLFRREKRI